VLFHGIIYGFLICSLFFLGYKLAKRNRFARRALFVSSIVIGIFSYLFSVRPDLFTKISPFSFAVFYSNLYPFAVALFIPVMLHKGKSRFHKIRIFVLSLILFFITLVPCDYFWGVRPEYFENRIDENGVCIQSSMDTCSAAAAVTLLYHFGIETTEQQVAGLALTRKGRGTNRLGLFRALNIITKNRGTYKVHLEHLSAEDLLQKNKPAIVTVGLSENPSTPEEINMARLYNWDPGVVHDVAFLGLDKKHPGKVKIGEPQFGLETWHQEHLEVLFRQMAIYLE